MSSFGQEDESGAASTEAGPHAKKSGRKPPKKSVAATAAAAELEERNKTKGDKRKDSEDDGDAEEEEEEEKPAGKEGGKNMLVDHTYTNYAILSDKELRMMDENSSMLPEPKSEEEKAVREKLGAMSCTYGPMKKSAGGVVQPFPGKLMEVLDRSDLVGIISWMPHGRAFIVKKPKLFAVDVLPRFFKQTKYLSFTRQLNLWGFKRITKGLDGGAYYHELFLRGRPYLAMRMKRHKVKGTGIKLTPNPAAEPLFYRDYPYMDQLDETRAIAPLPPLPPNELVFPDKESSFEPAVAGSAARSSLLPSQPRVPLAQYPQFSPHAPAVHNMMGAPHPFLTGSQGGVGIETPFLHGHPSPFGEGYGGLASMPGMRVNQSASSFLGGASGAYPAINAPRNYDNVLLAPGIAWGSVAASGQRVNDPIQDELSAMIRNRQSQTVAGAEMFPSQNLTSDRLLMERLRDVDRAAQLKREQQNISMLSMGGAGEAPAAFPAAPGTNFAFSGPSISNGLGNGPFDRYRQMSMQPGAMGFGAAYQGAFASAASTAAAGAHGAQNIDEEQQAVESSVKEALREANHLEELALAQRAKARNIALAGALQLTSRANGAAAPPQAQAPQAAASTRENDANKTPESQGAAKLQPKEKERVPQFSEV